MVSGYRAAPRFGSHPRTALPPSLESSSRSIVGPSWPPERWTDCPLHRGHRQLSQRVLVADTPSAEVSDESIAPAIQGGSGESHSLMHSSQKRVPIFSLGGLRGHGRMICGTHVDHCNRMCVLLCGWVDGWMIGIIGKRRIKVESFRYVIHGPS